MKALKLVLLLFAVSLVSCEFEADEPTPQVVDQATNGTEDPDCKADCDD